MNICYSVSITLHVKLLIMGFFYYAVIGLFCLSMYFFRVTQTNFTSLRFPYALNIN